MKWTLKKLRTFEQVLAEEFEAGLINCPLHLSGGNEEQLLNIFSGIKRTDWVLSTHRNHYHALLHGIPEKELAFRESCYQKIVAANKRGSLLCES